ncbi:MAG: hypothetical protein U1G07_26155 [Verrucomicrobiota bacterium]
MHQRSQLPLTFALSVLFVAACGRIVSAAPVEFVIDESKSSITLSGTAAGFSLQEQGPGSLVTRFYGSIKADLSAASIQFTGGSTLTARTNGVWSPGPNGDAGTAPADYAAKANAGFFGTIQGALRNIVLDLTSGPLPINNGQFDAAALVFGFPNNSTASFDYSAGFLGKDGIALTGLSTNKIVNGATVAGTPATLTIQVDTEFKFKAVSEGDSTVHLTGTLVATQQNSQEQFLITSIEIKEQQVVLHLSGAGAEPRLESSANLSTWTPRTPAKTTDANGTVLTLPLGGTLEFYRASK